MTKEQTIQRILDLFNAGVNPSTHTKGAIEYALRRYGEDLVQELKVKIDAAVGVALRDQLDKIYEQ